MPVHRPCCILSGSSGAVAAFTTAVCGKILVRIDIGANLHNPWRRRSVMGGFQPHRVITFPVTLRTLACDT